MHNLDGDLLLELSIGPLGKVNLAHPARTQGPQYPVRPYSISHHFWSMHPYMADVQTAAGLRPGAACVYESGGHAKIRRWTPCQTEMNKKPRRLHLPRHPPAVQPRVAAHKPMAAATSLRRTNCAGRPASAVPWVARLAA